MKETRVFELPYSYRKFRDIMRPDPRCQVCLSDCEEELTNVTDRLITCSLCLGTIHQQHYGSEIHSNVPQKWFCHRCRTFLASSTGPDSPVPDIRCDYCPLRSGIMKQVDYDKKKLWVHPECVIWDYPIRSFTTNTFETIHKTARPQLACDKFWYREFTNRSCKVCAASTGEFVKCRYYKCDAHYHVTCARKVGVVRELENMRLNQTSCYTPVLCSDHLELRVKDFKLKADQQRNKEKSAHYVMLMKAYQVQVDRMMEARTIETTNSTNFRIDFVQEQKQRSEISQKSSMVMRDEKVADMAEIDSDMCHFLEREIEDCFDVEKGFKIRTVIDWSKYDDQGNPILGNQPVEKQDLNEQIQIQPEPEPIAIQASEMVEQAQQNVEDQLKGEAVAQKQQEIVFQTPLWPLVLEPTKVEINQELLLKAEVKADLPLMDEQQQPHVCTTSEQVAAQTGRMEIEQQPAPEQIRQQLPLISGHLEVEEPAQQPGPAPSTAIIEEPPADDSHNPY